MAGAVRESPTHAEFAQRLERVKSEFLEMPGLRLTVAQAMRLFGLDQELSQDLLDVLVANGFLQRKQDSTYCRRLDDR